MEVKMNSVEVKSDTPSPHDFKQGDTVENVLEQSRDCVAENDNRHWHALRVPFLRVAKAKEAIDQLGYKTYLPYYKRKMHDVENHRLWYDNVPCIPNTLFVFGSRNEMKAFFEDPSLPPMSFLYDHCKEEGVGKNPPIIIPERQMKNFIKFCEYNSDHVVDVTNRVIKYKTDDPVRITEGEFKGVIGRVAKILGQTRVVVELGSLCLMATAYIPAACMEPLTKDEEEYMRKENEREEQKKKNRINRIKKGSSL